MWLFVKRRCQTWHTRSFRHRHWTTFWCWCEQSLDLSKYKSKRAHALTSNQSQKRPAQFCKQHNACDLDNKSEDIFHW
ncbi:Uncharacterised protein [Vibrio cholerae]|nr:Uncharacterised protein [Vibrio cholerae]